MSVRSALAIGSDMHAMLRNKVRKSLTEKGKTS